MSLTGEPSSTRRATPRVPAELREARTCYDHLAGRVAVAVADAFVARGLLTFDDDAGAMTGRGCTLLATLGVELPAANRRGRRLLCRPCLDWSERRPHLGGALGAALLERFLVTGWVRRATGSRAVTITAAGRTAFAHHFGIGDDAAGRAARYGG